MLIKEDNNLVILDVSRKVIFLPKYSKLPILTENAKYILINKYQHLKLFNYLNKSGDVCNF